MGKGSARRPLLESREVFESNWDETFGSKPPTCERCLVDEMVDDQETKEQDDG